MNLPEQGQLALGRCTFIAPEKHGAWHCTKVENHRDKNKRDPHMALCPTSLQPPYAVDFMHHWSK